MAIKILHAADFHMDSAFDGLSPSKAVERRREQRELLNKLADICSAENIDIVLLSGDLFDSSVSYFETHDALLRMLNLINAEVFISPGNHDYYCPKSPYHFLKFPPNVHIFSSSSITCFDIPNLNVRIYGTAFTAPTGSPVLNAFTVEDPSLINIMVMHGDMGGTAYAPFSENDIAASGLDYLALGHVHTFSGINKAGSTYYAYPGCLEGRGFDETGKKGLIIGSIDKGFCDLHFTALGGREYEVIAVDITDTSDHTAAVVSAVSAVSPSSICRVILSGEYSDAPPDIRSITAVLSSLVYSISVRDNTRPKRSVWEGEEEDTLRGVFLKKMHEQYDTADQLTKEKILTAVKCGIAALNGQEDWR